MTTGAPRGHTSFMGGFSIDTVLAIARRIVERHYQDDPIPQKHGPVVEVMHFGELGELVIEYPGILTPNWLIGKPKKFRRRRLAWWHDLQLIWCALGKYLIKVMEVEATNYFPRDAMETLAFKSLRYQTRG